MRHIIYTLVIVLFASTAHSNDLENIAVYRGVDGNLSQTSKVGLKTLRRAAIRQGTIGIWVTFDMEFEGVPSLRTPDVIQSEAEEKARLIEQVIEPIGSDAVLLDIPQVLEETPGCLVEVTARGLKRLSKSESVKHMSYYSL